MKIKFAIFFLMLCCVLNVFIYLITKNESRTINSILVSANTEDVNAVDINEVDVNEIDVNENSSETTSAEVRVSETVRVLISTSNYESLFHSQINFSNSEGLTVVYGKNNDKTKNIQAGVELIINSDSEYFESDTVYVYPGLLEDSVTKINSIKRNCGTPEYYGSFEINKTADGLTLINIVPVEKYVSGVVSSELNDSFHAEALKTQAVCARTYLYYIKEIGKYEEYNADIEDSTRCQVYKNNAFSEDIEAKIRETEGEVITYNGNVINAVYFSTSCGATTIGEVFNKDDMDYTKSIFVGNIESKIDLTNETNFQNFIDSGGEAISDENVIMYDSEYPYYRWNITESIDEIRTAIKKSTSNDVGTISKIEPTARMDGGVLSSVTVYGSKNTIVITGQDNIRDALCGSEVTVNLNDDSVRNISSLPSAFFYFNPIYKDGKLTDYELIGGGYGHGCGLSQNAADAMSNQGMSYKEIINFFYNGIEITKYER